MRRPVTQNPKPPLPKPGASACGFTVGKRSAIGDTRHTQEKRIIRLRRQKDSLAPRAWHNPQTNCGTFIRSVVSIMTATQTWNTTELVEKDKAHLLHPVSNLKDMRANGPLILAQGEGVYLWDTEGKQYIDAFAGLWNVNVGHGRKVLADAAAEQIMTVDFVPNFFGLASPPSNRRP